MRGILIIAGVAVVAGVSAFAVARGSAPTMKQPASQSALPVQSSSEEIQTKSTPQLPKGQYVTYSQQALAEANNTRLLFFHAPWCSQCQKIDADILAEGVPDGVSVFKVDYDTDSELRAKYGVTLQTTFVKINRNGDLIEKFVAYREPSFDSVRRELL